MYDHPFNQAHLLSIHGDNKKMLVINTSTELLFALDKHLLDYSFCTLFACQEEMYFGVGERNTKDDEYFNQIQQFSLQCKLVLSVHPWCINEDVL